MARTKQTPKKNTPNTSNTTPAARARATGKFAIGKRQATVKAVKASGRGLGGKGGTGEGGAGEKPVDREIRKLQNSTEPLIPLAPFVRVVREIAHAHRPSVLFQAGAIDALRHASEDHLIRLFQDSKEAAEHAGRVGISSKDIRLARRIRGTCWR